MTKDFWVVVWIGLALMTIPLLVTEQALGPIAELSAMTIEEDAEAVEGVVLGLPFTYRMTEESKQILVESGIWEKMLELVEAYGPERKIDEYGPELQLNDYVVFIVPETVHFAHENGIDSRLFLGTVAVGFQEIYMEMYGEP